MSQRMLIGMESLSSDSSGSVRTSPPGGKTAGPFAGWVLRPDVTGRLGWEAPNLPEWVRWWARFTFEELPTDDSRHE